MGYKKLDEDISFVASGLRPIGPTPRWARRAYPPAWKPYGLEAASERECRAMFTTILKDIWDTMCRQTCAVKCGAYLTGMAFNVFRGSKLLVTA